MNIIVFDVETHPLTYCTANIDRNVNTKRFQPAEIVRDWTMLSAAWKILGNERVGCVSVNPKNPLNDYGVVQVLYDVLSDADVLIGHNSDAFDLKKFNARAIFYGLKPIGPKKTIDTLKVARRYFKFTSNKLSYLANYLKIEAKGDSPNWDLILEGDENEIRLMREYNKQDVLVTEQLYYKLRSFHQTHPDLSIENPILDVAGERVLSCPVCNATDLRNKGLQRNKASTRQRWSCNGCGHHFMTPIPRAK